MNFLAEISYSCIGLSIIVLLIAYWFIVSLIIKFKLTNLNTHLTKISKGVVVESDRVIWNDKIVIYFEGSYLFRNKHVKLEVEFRDRHSKVYITNMDKSEIIAAFDLGIVCKLLPKFLYRQNIIYVFNIVKKEHEINLARFNEECKKY